MMKLSVNRKTVMLLGCLLVQSTGVGQALESASQHFREGIASFKANKMAAAAKEFEHAFQLAPGEPKIQYWLGRTLIQESRPNEIGNVQHLIDLFGKLSDEQKSADALYWLGWAYAKKGENHMASEVLRAALTRPTAHKVKEQQIRETLDKLATDGSGAGDVVQDLLVLGSLLVLAFLFIAALKQFVFVTPSTRRDVLLFLLTLLVFVFAALVFGWIDGGQFISVINSILKAS